MGINVHTSLSAVLAYIDPGTGSMLFAVLVGVIGTLNFLLRGWLVKIRFFLSGGRSKGMNEEKIPIAIFSDDKRYWSVFDPVCRELDKRGIDAVYMTASPDDPGLSNSYGHIRGEFIGEGNKAFAKMNFLNAGIVLSTTPGLDVYQWKRSRNVQHYVHIPHAASDITMYRMFGTDYYDTILLSGEYQVQQIRSLEKLRNLKEKNIVKIGIPYMDEMSLRLKSAEAEYVQGGIGKTTVLLAPSWGKSAIFSKYGGEIIDRLLKMEYNIIVRPHPQSFVSEKELISRIMEKYPESDRLEWNRDSDNFEVLRRSDILISDFSGVIFDFSLVHDKPVIYADTDFDKSPDDAWWIDEPLWTFKALPMIGEELTPEKFPRLKEMIEDCLKNPKYGEGRRKVREETWEHIGEGAKRTVDCLESITKKLAG